MGVAAIAAGVVVVVVIGSGASYRVYCGQMATRPAGVRWK